MKETNNDLIAVKTSSEATIDNLQPQAPLELPNYEFVVSDAELEQ